MHGGVVTQVIGAVVDVQVCDYIYIFLFYCISSIVVDINYVIGICKDFCNDFVLIGFWLEFFLPSSHPS